MTERTHDESDYWKWTDYPAGVYLASEITKPPHPRNTCLFDSDGYPVLIVLLIKILPFPLGTPHPRTDRHYHHRGFTVTVWLKDVGIPIINATGVVQTLEEIDELITRLKVEVDKACLHEDSEVLPTRWSGEHRFTCNICGETWGYDSSG